MVFEWRNDGFYLPVLFCDVFYGVENDPNVRLSNFSFENLKIKTLNDEIDKSLIQGINLKNVYFNGKEIQ